MEAEFVGGVIAVRGIRAYGCHGIEPGERDLAQLLRIDVVIEADLQRAACSDDLGDTIDYASVARRLAHVVESTSFGLLERLARELLDTLLRDPRVLRAEVTVAKPGILNGATPSVTLESRRP
jgi:dihydroneopterin aldolase